MPRARNAEEKVKCCCTCLREHLLFTLEEEYQPAYKAFVYLFVDAVVQIQILGLILPSKAYNTTFHYSSAFFKQNIASGQMIFFVDRSNLKN